MGMKKLGVGLLVGAAFAVSASAADYNLPADFGSSVFSYGSLASNGSVTAFSTDHSSGFCADYMASQPCSQAADYYQFIAAFPSVLYVNPGTPDSANDAIIFTAPTAGHYSLSGLASRGDSGGDGVHIQYYSSADGGSFFDAGVLSGDYGNSMGLEYGVDLQLGDILAIVISSISNNTGDGTFLTATISGPQEQIGPPQGPVPEPASWGLMLLGFGLVGTAMRQRRPSSVGVTFG